MSEPCCIVELVGGPKDGLRFFRNDPPEAFDTKTGMGWRHVYVTAEGAVEQWRREGCPHAVIFYHHHSVARLSPGEASWIRLLNEDAEEAA